MEYRGAVLDVDGTVVRGDEPIPGAPDGVGRIRSAGVEPLFVSNNPSKAPQAYVRRLSRAGYDVDVEHVVTAGTVSTNYLENHHPDESIYLVGAPGLARQFRDVGLSLVSDPDAADVVVVSLDKEFDYEELCAVQWALEDDDVPFYGTDPDVVIPAEKRNIPGSGALINVVVDVTGRQPDVVFGKPNEPTRRAIFERFDYDPAACFVVGDRLDTDIALGNEAGMTTVLVRSGITDEETLANAEIQPDYVLDSLAQIDRVLDGDS
ncbi:4-nitrophenyl phosphatase [Halalkaliarchaeum desulfuricum]|uniref:4-nitrophenyl phosphatase n=1 Tax=Halalkaliarchaeum desulfuricum TaxID=2055893 RepID=A0A343THJ2_9EURY|nr:HAD-IIA family hydrolase [Halalkaliarchaeum desulfuricum]AUX08564.1 4-nitrophenyl phosphatase [Halalkaliarchaeum desulfuricum]